MKTELLKKIESQEIYALSKVDGVQYIKVLGYFYDAGYSVEDDGKNWRGVEIGGMEMPLTEFCAMTEDQRYSMECESKQWIGDRTEDEVVDFFTGEDAPVELHFLDVNEDTPEGVYVSI